MPKVMVAKADHGKFKVLVNFIQKGADYSTEAIAKHQAEQIINEYASVNREHQMSIR